MKNFDKILPISDVKESLLNHVKDVINLGQTIAITKNGHPSAVLMSMNDYEGMVETIEILSNEKLMRSLRKSIKEADAGKFVSHEDVWGK